MSKICFFLCRACQTAVSIACISISLAAVAGAQISGSQASQSSAITAQNPKILVNDSVTSITPKHKMEVGQEVHQWIANEAYKYFQSQVDESSIPSGDRIGAHLGQWDNAQGDNQDTLLEGTAAEDKDDCPPLYQTLPYGNHFCAGADGSDIRTGLTYLFVTYDAALTQSENLWPYAVNNFADKKAYAFYCLGHVAHVLADQTVPAHVHNDPHIWPNTDAYEEWMGADHHFQRWYYGASRSGDWNRPLSVFPDLYSIFYRTIKYTEDYDSSDDDGRVSNGHDPYYPGDYPQTWHRPGDVSNSGDINDTELNIIGDDQMPYAICRVADLFRTFYAAVDATNPSVAVSYPSSTDPANPTLRSSTGAFNLTASASDPQSGIMRKRFQFHWRYWTGSAWSSWSDVAPSPTVASASFQPTDDMLYSFFVRAENGGGSTADSAVKYLRVLTPPDAPASIQYTTASSSGRYTVSWARAARAVAYQVERSADGGNTWTQPVYDGPNTSFDEVVIPNGSYRYRVRAVNLSGEGAWVTGDHDCLVIIPRRLTVESLNPTSGMAIALAPADDSGTSGGVTPFDRIYTNISTASLTAPSSAPDGASFVRWLEDGQDFANNTANPAIIALDLDHRMTAIYARVSTQTLMVNTSNTSDGVKIEASPLDLNGLGDGAAPFARSYYYYTTATLTAPLFLPPNKAFDHWIRNNESGVGAGSNSVSVLITDATTMTAVYRDAPALFARISGSIRGTTGTPQIGIAAVNNDQSVADSMQLTGDGVYALYVPKGFSGTVTIQAPDYIVSPFHRAYQALSDNRDGQDFALRGQLSSQTQLNGDYQIVYKKNGRGPNWYPSDICQFRDGGLEISSSTSSDTLKITKSAAARKARRATAPLRFIHSTGGFASLYSEADIAELRANGLLKRITTVNAAIGDCFTTGALGIIQMTSRPDAGADVITNIQATAGAAPLASLSLTGVKIETLRAGSQSFSAIKLISKKNTATSGSKTIAWVSESGFLGGAGVGNDLEILRARALTATGALLAPAIADGAIKAINTRGICVTANRTVGVYPAHISIGWLRDRDTSVTVSAVGGDIEPGLYLFDGRIALFSAKAIRLPKGANFPGAFAGGMIGNRDAPTTDIAPTTNALTVEGQVVVAAGLNVTTATTPASKINTARDIANVTGTDGVYGLFLAGATLTTDSAILAPDGMGRLLTVNTTASRGKGWLRIYGNESRPAKVLPAAMRDRIPILYNDKP